MRIDGVRILLAGLGLCCLPAFAQNAAELKRFAGTWEAKFKGAVICTFEVKAADKISGAASACNISVDSDGNLMDPESASEPAEPSPILYPKVAGNILTFEVRDETDEHPTKMEIQVKSSSQAELRIVDAPVRIKPIPLTKR